LPDFRHACFRQTQFQARRLRATNVTIAWPNVGFAIQGKRGYSRLSSARKFEKQRPLNEFRWLNYQKSKRS
jgi:hypothetical protein